MGVIFEKATDYRCKKYQIYTKIWEENGKRFVTKESIYPEGQEHIDRIYENYKLLQQFYMGSYDVVPCELENGRLIFPYLKGELFSGSFFKAVQDGNKTAFLALLKRYLGFIIINEQNKIPFHSTEEFRSIFGEFPDLDGVPALQVANLDSGADNIMLTNGKMTAFDYEWVFNFPIPVDYIVFRNLINLYRFDAVSKNSFLSLQEACDYLKISISLNTLQKMENIFFHSIISEPWQTGNMIAMKNQYLQSTSVSSGIDEGKCYFDTGSGFSEQAAVRNVNLSAKSSDSVIVKLQIPASTKQIRFDPVEGQYCVLRDFSVKSNTGPLNFQVANGFCFHNYIVFDNIDPQIIIQTENNSYGWVQIQACRYLYDKFEVFNLICQLQNHGRALEDKSASQEQKNMVLQAEIRELKTKNAELSSTVAGLAVDRECVNGKYLTVINSTCWKITKPLRVVLDGLKKALKSNCCTKLCYKGLAFLKNNGIRQTILQVKIHYKKEKVINQLWNKEELKIQRRTVFPKPIKFSILVPLYNTPKNFLEDMITSVRNQTYENWELCLADGSGGEHLYVGKICRKARRKDSRIKYQKLERNLGISENTNRCIEMSVGDYLGLLDHDDILHPSALFEVMKVICDKGADFIYTDENTFSKTPKDAYCPNFKPDFAPDTLRSLNYICHFTVFDRNLLKQTGLYRKDFDGSQDYDMVLRLTEKAEHIVHIPKILYYWRAHSASVASDASAKPYVVDTAKKALTEHLNRVGLEGMVTDSTVRTTYKINYQINGNPLISILIPNKDHIDDLQKCIGSIQEITTYPNYEIVVIENNSTEEDTFAYYEKLRSYPNISVVTWDGPFNYSAINNFGFQHTKGDYVVLLNNDIEVITPDWLQKMLMFAQRKDVGAVGAMLYYPDDTIQHAGVILGIGGVAGHSHKYFKRSSYGNMGRLTYAQNISAVTGACMMLPRRVFEEVHGLDETFAVAFNDVDFCMRIRKAGYLIVFTPYAELYHYESKSRGLEDTPEKKKRFEKEVLLFQIRWKKELEAGDPYYNPNFTLDTEDFSIKRELLR